MLWGLDPVFAHELLKNISVVDLTFVRYSTFLLASIIGYATHTYFSSAKLKPLSPFHPLLLFSGCALFLTGLLTYLTVDTLFATQYILFIIGGLILTVLLRQALLRQLDWLLFAIGVLIAATLAGDILPKRNFRCITYPHRDRRFARLRAVLPTQQAVSRRHRQSA